MSARILLVDDDEFVIRAIRRALRDHAVVAVTDPVEARALIAAGEPFDVVISDLMMPVMSGAQLFEEIERIAPDLARRFIFVTAGATTVELQTFLRECGQPILDKPVDLARLVSTIEALVKSA